jgi:hypothetical protein
MQTTGMGLLGTGTKANFCNYTELLFCDRCMAPEPRPIPWRVVQDLDDTPHRVSAGAADYIDRIADAPIVALSAIAPRTLARSKPLQHVTQLRARLADLLEAVAVGAAEVEAREGYDNADAGEGDSLADDENDAALAQLPSESQTPLKKAVMTSRAAATAFRECMRLFRQTAGERLVFMTETVELLPISLIVVIDDGDAKVVPRLTAAVRGITQYASARGYNVLRAAGTEAEVRNDEGASGGQRD